MKQKLPTILKKSNAGIAGYKVNKKQAVYLLVCALLICIVLLLTINIGEKTVLEKMSILLYEIIVGAVLIALGCFRFGDILVYQFIITLVKETLFHTNYRPYRPGGGFFPHEKK